MINPTDADIGRHVIYIPPHAKGDREHPDCEVGFITSVRADLVFVNYGRGPTSAGGKRENMVWEFSNDNTI